MRLDLTPLKLRIEMLGVNGKHQRCAATKDAHFAVPGFSSSSGEPVMCAVIFAAKSFHVEWRTQVDTFAMRIL